MTAASRCPRPLAGWLVVAALLSLAFSCEGERRIEITFVNDTERVVAMMIVRDGDTLDDKFDRSLAFPSTHEPGVDWRHDGGLGNLADADQPRCEPRKTYYFVSPIDPTVTSRARQGTDPKLDIDEVDIVDVLEHPCWDSRTGNRYSVGG